MAEIISLALHRRNRRRGRDATLNAEPAQIYLFDGVRIERRSDRDPDLSLPQAWRAGRGDER
jgi:hypothetical protein